MLQERGGIARTAIATIVIIIVAVAGISAYFVLTTSSTPTTTSSTTSSSTPTTTSSTSTSSSTHTTASSTSTTQTTASSSSTSTSTLSTSCTTTSTSTQPASVIIPLLNAYSAVTQTFNGTLNGESSNFTASYTVVHVNSTTYEVNIVDKVPGQTYSTTVWLLKDGTVVALDLAGHNFTGASASTHFQTYFAPWEQDIEFGQQITTSTSFSFFHSAGTSTVTLGPSTFIVTNYAANSLPETISLCNGDSETLTTAGSFSVGTPSGSSYPLITYIDVAGSGTIGGAPSTYSFIAQITSVKVA